MMSACVFIVRISSPLLTQRDIIDLLLNRSIKVKSMNLHCVDDREGIILVHCTIEKDRIKHTGNLLEKIKGVIEVEILHSHGSNRIKEQ